MNRRDVLKRGAELAGLGIGARGTGVEIWPHPVHPIRYLTPEQVRQVGDSDWETLQRLANMLGSGISARIDREYVIDRQIEIVGKSGFSIIGDGRILVDRQVPPTYGHSVFYFSRCSNFQVEGLTCDGNRLNRSTAEAPGHLVVLDACHHWKLNRVRAVNGTTDGFLVCTTAGQGTGPAGEITLADIPSDWLMEDCEADNNFRQGLTICESLNWVVRGGRYTGTRGLWDCIGSTGPCAGIDLEPDLNPAYPRDRLRFGRIENVAFDGNQGAGLLISSIDGVSDIFVDRCVFTNNGKAAIECTARNVKIVAPRISGWASQPYSTRSNVPPKRGLIDIGAFAGPDIEVADAVISGIQTEQMQTQPVIYIHSSARPGIRITGLKANHGVQAVAHLHGPDIVMRGCELNDCGEDASTAAILSTGHGLVFSNNRISGPRLKALVCMSSRPVISNNVFTVIETSRSGFLVDCRQATDVEFTNNIIQHRTPAATSDISLSSSATVVGNRVINSPIKHWISAPAPKIFRDNQSH